MPGMSDMMPAGREPRRRRARARSRRSSRASRSFERNDPYALIREPTRVARIAKGSGQPEPAVQELVQKFLFMKQMMDGLGQNMGMMGKIPGMKNLAMAKNLRKQMAQGGGFPGMPAAWACPAWAVPRDAWHGNARDGHARHGDARHGRMGMPGDSMTKMKPMSASEKNAKKAQRKREKEARKKSRR